MSQPITGDSPSIPATEPRPLAAGPRIHVLIAALVLGVAMLQGRIGGATSVYGEESGIGLPIATIGLAIGLVLALVAAGRHWAAPRLSGWHLAFIAAACIGLLGLPADALKPAVKELIQLGEYAVAAWLLTAVLPRRALPLLAFLWGAIGLVALCLPGALLEWTGLSPARRAAMVVITIPLTYYFWRRDLRGNGAMAATVIGWAGLLGIGLRATPQLLLVGLALIVGLILVDRSHRRLLLVALAAAVVCASVATGGWRGLSSRYDADHGKRLVLEAQASRHAPSLIPFGGGLGQYKPTINYLRSFDSAQPAPAENKVPRDANSQYLLLLVESGILAPLCLLALLLVLAWRLLRLSPAASDADAQGQIALPKILAICLLGVAGAALFSTVLGRGSGIWVGALIGMATALLRPDPAAATTADGAASDAAPSVAARLGRWQPLAWQLVLPLCIASACLVAMLQRNQLQAVNDPRSQLNRQAAARLAPGAEPAAAELQVTTVSLEPDEQGDLLRIEGEAYVSASGAFRRIQDNHASGHAALELPIDSGKAQGEAVYHLTLPEAGDYLLQARVLWADGCSNSLAFELADQQVTVSSELFETWHELSARSAAALPAGELTIRVKNLEDGVRLDYLSLLRVRPSAQAATN